MQSKSLYATVAGPILSFSFIAFSFLILTIVGKSYAPVAPLLKQIESYAGKNLDFYAGIIGFVLLIVAFSLSFIDQKMLQQKMAAKTESEKWVLALSAIYVELSKVLENDDIESFYRIDMTRAWYMFIIGYSSQLKLNNRWGIFDRSSALQTLNTLFLKVQDGRKKPYIAWDGVRFSYVVRLACLNGYLTPKEAWEQLRKIGVPMQKAFSSWRELNENFIKGRELWNAGDSDLNDLKASYNQLATHMKSPWNSLEWNMKLSTQF